MKKVSDFDVMKEIASHGTSDGIAMFPTIVSMNKVKAGCHVTFGAPDILMDWMLNDSHYVVMYAIKKEDFDKIKNK